MELDKKLRSQSNKKIIVITKVTLLINLSEFNLEPIQFKIHFDKFNNIPPKHKANNIN